MAQGFEFFADFNVVEYLAVVRDRERVVFESEWLIALRTQVENREPAMA